MYLLKVNIDYFILINYYYVVTINTANKPTHYTEMNTFQVGIYEKIVMYNFLH